MTTLFTPTLSVETINSAKSAIDLNVMNASCSPRSGNLEIVRLDGTSLSTSNYVNVAPGVGTGIEIQSFPSGGAPVTLIYGKVTVDDAPESIRANLVLRDYKGNALVSVAAH